MTLVHSLDSLHCPQLLKVADNSCVWALVFLPVDILKHAVIEDERQFCIQWQHMNLVSFPKLVPGSRLPASFQGLQLPRFQAGCLWQLEICSHMHKIGSFFCVSCRLLGRELQGVIEKALKSSPVFDSTLVSKKNTEGICTCVDFQIFTDNQPGNLCTDNQLHSQGFTPILF